MRLFVSHRTAYRFSQPQARVVQLLRMMPGSHHGQNVVDWRIDVDCNARLKPGRDGFGNDTTMLYVDGPIERIELSVTGEVLTDDRAGVISGATEPLPPLAFLQPTRLTPMSEDLAAFAHEAAGEGALLDRAHRLSDAVHRKVSFDVGHRGEDRPLLDAFNEGGASYREIAHVMVAAARAIGLPARYVSGHLLAEDNDHAHGWAELHVDKYGWIGFDAAHALCPDDRYVRVAVGLDYRDAAPVSGARTGGGWEVLEVGVHVGTSQDPQVTA